MENLYVKLNNVQFSRLHVNPENPSTFASEDNDEFDGERIMESCEGDFPFILSTSTYADFSALQLPKGSGSVQGILTRDFYDEFSPFILTPLLILNFIQLPVVIPRNLPAEMSSSTGSKIFFEDDFEGQKNNKPVDGKGWKNIVQEGSKPWEAFTATGANASLGRSARMRPGGSGDSRSVSWLITPKINFDTNQKEVLSFKTSTSFSNGSFWMC